jgi:hypothetical protein
MSAHSGALEAVDRILNRGGANDDVLRAVVAVLHERLFAWVAVVDAAGRVRAEAGVRPAEPSLRAPIGRVGELEAEPREPSGGDIALVERVALVISAHVT